MQIVGVTYAEYQLFLGTFSGGRQLAPPEDAAEGCRPSPLRRTTETSQRVTSQRVMLRRTAWRPDVAGVAPPADGVPEDGREAAGVAPPGGRRSRGRPGSRRCRPSGVAPWVNDARENGLEAVSVVPPEDGEGAAGDDTGPSAPLTPTAPHRPAGLRSCLAVGKATQARGRLAAEQAAHVRDRVAAGQAAQEQETVTAQLGPRVRTGWPQRGGSGTGGPDHSAGGPGSGQGGRDRRPRLGTGWPRDRRPRTERDGHGGNGSETGRDDRRDSGPGTGRDNRRDSGPGTGGQPPREREGAGIAAQRPAAQR